MKLEDLHFSPPNSGARYGARYGAPGRSADWPRPVSRRTPGASALGAGAPRGVNRQPEEERVVG